MAKKRPAEENDSCDVVGFLLEREARPVAVFDAHDGVAHANDAFARLVASEVPRLRGRSASELFETHEDIRRARRGELRTLQLGVRGANGARLVLSAEAHRVGGALVVVVASWSAAAPFAAGEATYDVSIAERRVQWASDGRASPGDRCYAKLYGRSAPCPACPVGEASPAQCRTAVLARGRHADLVTATIVGPDTARLSVRRVDDALFGEIVRARVDAMAEGAKLTAREREVFERLVAGDSSQRAGDTLRITPSTVKFHQANVLRKLGVSSRLEVLRRLLAT